MHKNKVLTLAISHNISLTKEQRYRLAEGEAIRVVGVSLPVWYAKGKTSEPAKEIFCNYTLYNTNNMSDEILLKMDGYDINLPQIYENDKIEPTEYEIKLEESMEPLLSAKNLLDVADGGSTCLRFSRTGRGKVRDIPVNIYHNVKISDISDLTNSLC